MQAINALLKFDREENPDLVAMASMVYFDHRPDLTSEMAYSILNLFFQSLKLVRKKSL